MKGFIEVNLGYKTENKCLISIDNIDIVFQHKDKKVLHHDKTYIIETNSWIQLKRETANEQRFLLVVETYEEINQKIKEAQEQK